MISGSERRESEQESNKLEGSVTVGGEMSSAADKKL